VLTLISKAKKTVISFDISKTKLIHFYSKCTTIEKGLKLRDVEISPKPLVRWLGVFLDSKLIFKQHHQECFFWHVVALCGNLPQTVQTAQLRQWPMVVCSLRKQHILQQVYSINKQIAAK